MWYIAFILATIAINTVPRWIPGIDGDLFTFWQSVSFVTMGIAMWFPMNTKTDRIVRDWCILLAINNAIDEYYRVAQKTNEFEIIFAIAVTTWTAYRLTKCRSKTKPMT